MIEASLMEAPGALRRQLNLPLLVLYGVGITVGAGIYVLIGAVAGHAGVYTPWSFVLAAIVMAFTVASYAELSTRFPVSAGEAAYVRAAFQSRLLSTLTGLLTIVIGIASSATVTLGSAGYIEQFLDLPQSIIVVNDRMAALPLEERCNMTRDTVVHAVLGFAMRWWGSDLSSLPESPGYQALLVENGHHPAAFAAALLCLAFPANAQQTQTDHSQHRDTEHAKHMLTICSHSLRREVLSAPATT
jgi:amino acid transporter